MIDNRYNIGSFDRAAIRVGVVLVLYGKRLHSNNNNSTNNNSTNNNSTNNNSTNNKQARTVTSTGCGNTSNVQQSVNQGQLLCRVLVSEYMILSTSAASTTCSTEHGRP